MNKTFKVDGITCDHCVAAIRKAILRLDNTAKIQIDMDTQMVSIASDQPRSALAAAIQEAGYSVNNP